MKDIAGKGFFISVAVLIVMFATSGALVPASAQSVQDVVASVEGHYRDLGDLTAKIVQKNFLKSVNKTQIFDGALWIKKPGKLRLEYSNAQMILIENKTAIFYSRKNEQLIRKTFTDFEHMNIPVAFLLGAASIRNDFDVSQPEANAARLLELVPKKPGAAMKKLRIQTDDSGRITILTIFDKSGNTTELQFAEIREGVGLEDSLFVFKAPKGTEIIEQ